MDVAAAAQAKERRLEAQFALSGILSSATSVDAAAPRVLHALGESLGSSVSELWLRDEDALRCRHAWHAPGLDARAFATATAALTFAHGEGLPGKVWSSGAPAWATDVTRDPLFQRRALAAELGVHAAVAFPIQFAGEVLGVIEFFYATPRPADDALLRLFADVGGQLGLFVERTRMGEKAVRLAREIVELSTPILTVWDGVLVAPLIGTLEAERANRLTDRLLAAIEATHARVVLLDVTGVASVDTEVVRHLTEMVHAAQLLGARVHLTGIAPRVAATLARLGVTFEGVSAFDSLARGLSAALAIVGRVGR